MFTKLIQLLDIHESSVPFENQPGLFMHDGIMALELVKIAIIDLVNTIKSSFVILHLPNLYSS